MAEPPSKRVKTEAFMLDLGSPVPSGSAANNYAHYPQNNMYSNTITSSVMNPSHQQHHSVGLVNPNIPNKMSNNAGAYTVPQVKQQQYPQVQQQTQQQQYPYNPPNNSMHPAIKQQISVKRQPIGYSGTNSIMGTRQAYHSNPSGLHSSSNMHQHQNHHSTTTSMNSHMNPHMSLQNNSLSMPTNNMNDSMLFVNNSTNYGGISTQMNNMNNINMNNMNVHNNMQFNNLGNSYSNLGYQQSFSSSASLDAIEIHKPFEAQEIIMYGTVLGNIISHEDFNGIFTIGDTLTLEREDDPEFDMVLFKVINPDEEQVGYLDEGETDMLKMFLESEHCDASIKVSEDPDLSSEKVPVRIFIYGQRRDHLLFERQLASKFPDIEYISWLKAEQLDNEMDGTSGLNWNDLKDDEAGYLRNPEVIQQVESDLEKLFVRIDYNNLPRRKAHRSIIPRLHPYQQQGLHWMFFREQRRSIADTPESVWEKTCDTEGNIVWYNRLTKNTVKFEPIDARGGILADEMGLGKTLQIITLVASTARSTVNPMAATNSDSLSVSSSLTSGYTRYSQSSMAGLASSRYSSSYRDAQLKKESIREEDIGTYDDVDDADDLYDLDNDHKYYDDDDDEDEDFDSFGMEKEKKPVVVKNSTDNPYYVDINEVLPQDTSIGPTLIVCPVSVLSNWEDQFRKHVRPGHLRMYTYHGPSRVKEKDFLNEYDVVLSTYNIIAQECPKHRAKKHYGKDVLRKKKNQALNDAKSDGKDGSDYSPLYDVEMVWFRVVLDEAHVIRNRGTKQFAAACALTAERRWAVTGTPLQNNITDTFALFHFLRVQPFMIWSWFKNLILTPFKNKDVRGMERLQKLMSSVCLRRKKSDELKGKLPPKHLKLVKIDLVGDEKRLYDNLADSGKQKFNKLRDAGTVGKNYAFVLEMLLRMRQACDHPDLIPNQYHKGFIEEAQDKAGKLRRLLLLLEQANHDGCGICYRNPSKPCVTTCAHFFCQDCVFPYLQSTSRHACPTCDTELSPGDLVCEDHRISLDRQEQHIEDMERKMRLQRGFKPSQKVLRLIHDLNSFEEYEKSVVFSQWTSMLDLVAQQLKREEIDYVRLDGAMTAKVRARAINNFQSDPKYKVFLISLKAGGVGLNLTAANKVFLLDPWWNPATEDQAIDRVHRLGQTRDVDVIRYICKDTVEERIQELQQKKREMIKSALTRHRTKREKQEEKMNDIATLFG